MTASGLSRTLYSNNHPVRNGRGAFTLVELLVVISVIALLIAILLPSLNGAREQARSVKCLANQKEISNAMNVFAGSHNGFCQLYANDGDEIIGRISVDPDRKRYEYDADGELLCWPAALAKAAGAKIVSNSDWGVLANDFQTGKSKLKSNKKFEQFICPSDKVEINTPMYPSGTSIKAETSSSELRYWGYLSYGINEDLLGVEDKPRHGVAWPAVFRNDIWGENSTSKCYEAGLRLRGNLDRVQSPSECLLTVDAGLKNSSAAKTGTWDLDTALGFGNSVDTARVQLGPCLENFINCYPQRLPFNRHGRKGTLNIGFCDGSGHRITVGAWKDDPFYLIEEVPKNYSQTVRISPYRR